MRLFTAVKFVRQLREIVSCSVPCKKDCLPCLHQRSPPSKMSRFMGMLLSYKRKKRKFLSIFLILYALFSYSFWVRRSSRFSHFSLDLTTSVQSVESEAQPRARLHSTAIHTIKDTCTKKKYSCSLDSNKFSYIYFLAQPYSLVVSEDNVKLEYNKLNYFNYTVASVSRLVELTTLPILILITSELWDKHINFLQSISEQIAIKKIEPAYENMSISVEKKRHIHTFGKFEVLSPKSTLGFSRLVFMVKFSLRSPLV